MGIVAQEDMEDPIGLKHWGLFSLGEKTIWEIQYAKVHVLWKEWIDRTFPLSSHHARTLWGQPV